MADTDNRIDDAAPAQGSALEVARSGSEPKSSLRRRVIAPDKTALSSGAPAVPPASPIVSSATASDTSALETVAAKAALAEDSGSKAHSAAKPVASGKPVAPDKTKKFKASKPLPVVTAAKPVAAKPLPPQHLAAVKAQPVKAAPAKRAAALTPQPLSAAKPAVAPARTVPDVSPAVPAQPVFEPKDKIMDMSANFSSFQDAISDAQAKAKAAFEKSSTVFGEVGEFAKGNVEAVIASGKILAEGVQEIGTTLVAESRTAFETATGDFKELAAAKSPTDFLKLQSDIVRKNFDSAVAYGSKNSETFLKLMNDAFAPISGRVSLAVEKARQAAPVNAAPVNTAAV